MVTTTVSKFFSWYFGYKNDILDINTEKIIGIFSNIIDDEQIKKFDNGNADKNDIIRLFIFTLKWHKNDKINIEVDNIIDGYSVKFHIDDIKYGKIDFDLPCMNGFKC